MDRPAGGRKPLVRRIFSRAAVRWLLIGGLAALLAFFIYAIVVAGLRTGFSAIQLLLVIAFLLPIAGALVALLWYGRTLGSAQAAARASEESFRTVAATMADGIITIDDRSRIQYVNGAAERIFGYAREEMLGHELTMLMPESMQAKHRAGISRYLTTGTRKLNWESLPLSGRTKAGNEVPLEISLAEHRVGDRRVLTGVVRDVSERRRSEEAIAESEAKFRGLFAATPDAIFVVSAEGVIQDANAAGEALVGRVRSEIIGRKLTEFIPPERVPLAERYLADRLAGLRAPEIYDGVWRTGGGEERINVQLTSQVVRSPNEEPYLVVSVRNVTDQQEMQRRLLESERWASMGRLASFVAHEINTPLTNISLLTASIARRISDPEAQERLKKITVQGKIAASITAELLKFARPGAINPVETDLTDVVREAVEQAEAFRKPGVELRKELGEKPVLCTIDPLRIQEVFVNLLKNAFEATANGRVRVRLQDLGSTVAVSVSDTGTGIPSEVQQRLFEAFYTTKKKGEGTGLGLAISRNFVTNHGGDITVLSEVGKGSTFTVVLPKHPLAVRQAA